MIVKDGISIQIPEGLAVNSQEAIDSYIKPTLDLIAEGMHESNGQYVMQIVIVYDAIKS